MTALHILDATFGLTPFDFIIALFSLVIVFGKFKEGAKGFGIFLQVSLILIKMTQHYFANHPHAKSPKHRDLSQKLDSIYHKHLVMYDKNLRTGEETGAQG